MGGIVLSGIDDTRELLVEWGEWAAANTLVKGLGRKSLSRQIAIDDDLGLAIDRAISAMGRRDNEAQEIIMLCYVKQLTYRSIATTMSIKTSSVKARLDAAVYWLDGVFIAQLNVVLN